MDPSARGGMLSYPAAGESTVRNLYEEFVWFSVQKRRHPWNRLLARLPPEEYAQLLPHLETARVRARRALSRLNTPPPEVHFPDDGVCVISDLTRDGRTSGVALVGKEDDRLAHARPRSVARHDGDMIERAPCWFMLTRVRGHRHRPSPAGVPAPSAMQRSALRSPRGKNRILARLPASEYRRISSVMTSCSRRSRWRACWVFAGRP